jgi:hypothetical protein
MARRALPALLALIALFADLSGSHGVALGFVLAAIPRRSRWRSECYGDALEARCGGLRPLCRGAGLVAARAERRAAEPGGRRRRAAARDLGDRPLLLLYAGALLGALLAAPRPVPRRSASPSASRRRCG